MDSLVGQHARGENNANGNQLLHVDCCDSPESGQLGTWAFFASLAQRYYLVRPYWVCILIVKCL